MIAARLQPAESQSQTVAAATQAGHTTPGSPAVLSQKRPHVGADHAPAKRHHGAVSPRQLDGADALLTAAAGGTSLDPIPEELEPPRVMKSEPPGPYTAISRRL